MLDAVRWSAEGEPDTLPGKLRLIDQTQLPGELVYLEIDDAEEIHDAVKRLVVRGAPAIGCAAALGLAAVGQHHDAKTPQAFVDKAYQTADYLATSRPTAVNLFWALDRCKTRLANLLKEDLDVYQMKQTLLSEALAILHEDMALCKAIGQHGVSLFQDRKGCGVLTHCNAGALATSDYGTALSPIYTAHEQGLQPRVFADETRPLLQGARLTTWELMQAEVDVTLICDNMAAEVMREGKIALVIVGADRIAANGDAANKIGTYGVAVLAHHHNIPFYVAAPSSTLDHELDCGKKIPIEQRAATEITHGFGRRTAPDNCKVYSPAFDVTPADLITGIITERDILKPPFTKAIAQFT
ncbi:MAG: S-methyl-5-thioribose-1-phosphate isomerase [Lentisphaeria bacterium]